MSLLIKSTTPPDFSRQNWLPTADANVYLGDGYSPVPTGATIIAQAGVVLNQTEYLAIRPLGNAAGLATPSLLYQHFMGESQLIAGDPQATDPIERLYPAANRPYDAECRHKYFTDPAHPQVQGWGFRFELIGSAVTRDPAARAIGVYSDAACTQYLWTTGALSLGPSDWQVDAQGQPLQVWFTNSWDGDRPAAKKTWNVAILKGSAQEGHQTLSATADGMRFLFWEHDQGWVAPPDATWVDTGSVAVLASAWMYTITPKDPCALLKPGEIIRLGPTMLGKFKQIWPGTDNWMQLDSTDPVNYPNPGALPANTHLWRFI